MSEQLLFTTKKEEKGKGKAQDDCLYITGIETKEDFCKITFPSADNSFSQFLIKLIPNAKFLSFKKTKGAGKVNKYDIYSKAGQKTKAIKIGVIEDLKNTFSSPKGLLTLMNNVSVDTLRYLSSCGGFFTDDEDSICAVKAEEPVLIAIPIILAVDKKSSVGEGLSRLSDLMSEGVKELAGNDIGPDKGIPQLMDRFTYEHDEKKHELYMIDSSTGERLFRTVPLFGSPELAIKVCVSVMLRTQVLDKLGMSAIPIPPQLMGLFVEFVDFLKQKYGDKFDLNVINNMNKDKAKAMFGLSDDGFSDSTDEDLYEDDDNPYFVGKPKFH